MSDFPVVLTNAVDGAPGIGTPIAAKHLNNLEVKVGIDGSAVATSLDYLLKNVASIDPGHKHSKLWASDGSPEAITVDAAGKVGLGVTPGAFFHAELPTPATATVNSLLISRLSRATVGGVKYGNTFDILLGSYLGTGFFSNTRVDFKLADSTATPDRTVLTLCANGRVGVNIEAPGSALDIYDYRNESFADYNVYATNHIFSSWNSTNVNDNAVFIGQNVDLRVAGTSNYTNSTGVIAYQITFTGYGSGIISNLIGMSVHLDGNLNPVTNAYCIHLDALTGTITNKWAIYQAGPNDRNYFAGNIGLGTEVWGTSAAKTLGIGAGTAPTTAPADMGQLWVEDINGAAGYAGLHKMTETTALKEVVPGVIIKTDTGSPANPYEGLMEINTFDNKINMYADGGWRQLATW